MIVMEFRAINGTAEGEKKKKLIVKIFLSTSQNDRASYNLGRTTWETEKNQ